MGFYYLENSKYGFRRSKLANKFITLWFDVTERGGAYPRIYTRRLQRSQTDGLPPPGQTITKIRDCIQYRGLTEMMANRMVLLLVFVVLMTSSFAKSIDERAPNETDLRLPNNGCEERFEDAKEADYVSKDEKDLGLEYTCLLLMKACMHYQLASIVRYEESGMFHRLQQQMDAGDMIRKRSYWRQCAFNAVSCFGK
ncbi:hypothetical protein J437_LFUL016989 [Ladona fulva]|uniref:Uncharacterized protein n=1 Tax=Ladona fulva TaxID=123851 RepID=A0A8K0KKR4_LADFU|nr:hypothetical protein J437_LFUL016989 [Ladona fulva]